MWNVIPCIATNYHERNLSMPYNIVSSFRGITQLNVESYLFSSSASVLFVASDITHHATGMVILVNIIGI